MMNDQQGFAIKLSKNQHDHYGSQFGDEGDAQPPGIIGELDSCLNILNSR